MTINTVFELYDKVFIKELNIAGKVMSYFFNGVLQYYVRYFDSGEINHEYFLESELIGIEPD